MPTLYTTIGPWTFPTFNLFLTLAVLVSAAVGLRRIHKTLTPSPSWRGVIAGSIADAYLGALVGAVIGARFFHVLLNWNYFAENLNEVSMISLGGLDWHGGVIGGLISLYGVWWLRTNIPTPRPPPFRGRYLKKWFVGVRRQRLKPSGYPKAKPTKGAIKARRDPGNVFRLMIGQVFKKPTPESQPPPHTNREGEQQSTRQHISFYALLDSLTPALPLIGLAAWWGCLAASCGYGAEVDNLSNYPAFAVSETADVYGIAVPRYNTQMFGLFLSLIVLLVVIVLFWLRRQRLKPSGYPKANPTKGAEKAVSVPQWQFWFVLGLLSTGMFMIGFYRGDHALYRANLRLDQLLDVMFIAMSVLVISFQRSAKE